jgi:signal peptidase
MKTKNIVKKTLKALVVAFIILEVALMCFVMIFKISGKNPTLFGYQFYVIVSPSMEPELGVGDVILSKKYVGQPIETGDIITFLGKEGSLEGKVVTHQVIEVEEINGELSITTKGLANNIEDPSIKKEDVLSIMKYKTVGFGFIYRLMSTAPGFIFLILLPLLILIASEIYRLAKILHGDEDDEDDQQKGGADDDEKQNV